MKIARLPTMLALLLATAPLYAAGPTIDILPEIRATGDYVTFTPKTDAKAIAYVAQSGVDAFPSDFLRDPRSFVLSVRGLAAGRYNFVAVGTLNDEQTKQAFTVVVGDVPPGPGPGPGPGPTPPAPTPTPSSDPIWQRIVSERETDAMAGRSTRDAVAKLASVYRMAAQTTVSDQTLTTAGQLIGAVSKAAAAVVPLPTLQRVRETIAEEFQKQLPRDPATPLDAALRTKYRDQFARMAAILEALSKL